MHATTIALGTSCGHEHETIPANLLSGFRFRLAESGADWDAGLGLREHRHHRCPDAYDHRSWLLLAEEEHTRAIAGSVRITPRATGPLEAERHFPLPPRLRTPSTIEIARLATLPGHADGSTFVPAVQLGLFRLVHELAARIGARHGVVRDRSDRAWLYDWLRFTRLAFPTPADRQLLFVLDLTRALDDADAHPFGSFFRDLSFPEIVLPRRIPAPGPVSAAASTPRACA